MPKNNQKARQQSIDWKKSAQMRWAVGLFVSGSVGLLHAFGVWEKIGIEPQWLKEHHEIVVDGLMALVPMIGGVVWAVKRVKAALVPKPPPVIEPPKVVEAVADAATKTVATVKRLTR